MIVVRCCSKRFADSSRHSSSISNNFKRLQLFSSGRTISGLSGSNCQQQCQTSVEDELGEIFKLRHTNVSNWIIENKVKQLCCQYGPDNAEGQRMLLQQLATRYSVSQENVVNEAKRLLEAKEPHNYENLKKQLTPAYHWLFVNISRLEGGVKFLVDLKAYILELMKKETDASKRAELKQLNNELHNLFLLWFSVGFFHLHRVTWCSPCDILERIAFYEVIHPLRNWTDLKQRLGPFRRCYIFTHPSMPREPIVILHTALCNTIPASTMEIPVSQKRIHGADNENTLTFADEQNDAITSAIFYSISSPHKGLQGIELGNYLIKEVARKIKAEFSAVNTLATLSPIPGFGAWLNDLLAKRGISLFTQSETERLKRTLEGADIVQKLQESFKRTLWSKNEQLCEILRQPFLELCAWYLCKEKGGKYAQDKVANFHLRNGATVYRINWMANNTVTGLSRGFGMMVNYRYYLNKSEENSRRYLEDYVIQTSEDVDNLIRSGEERLRNAGHFDRTVN